ncbi:acyl-CoA synthetase [Haematobacter massiliensis]|uniref:AMP-binding protein n=1 Tax=Haematobacter massiliensis TaxID=195105 RepID=UPI0005575495|nr:AMP-binding protein [Haematobacter massiliensis]OWJ69878.1 acyl-CoA synthetase [Haematobacter massiliensis]OWJ83674.1 acyl-CoA synthetase [Haematobacter massiliensis]QBJ25930.1 acyl-CoA synthetase [Haematobacter massiliensis]
MPSTTIDETAYLADLAARRAQSWPKDIPAEITYPLGERPLSDYLRHWGATQAAETALIYYGTEITWGELDRLSEGFANLLQGLGIGKGDRVAVFLPNCPQFHIAFFGILKLGAVHVPISPLSKGYELAYHLNDSGAEVIVAQDTLLPIVDEVREETRLRKVFATSLSELVPEVPAFNVPGFVRQPSASMAGAEPFLPAVRSAPKEQVTGADLDGVAALNYTGGTTGMPKGCVHTQRDMLYTGAANWSVAMAGDRELTFLSYFPEFWIAGENAALVFPVVTGRPLVLLSRWDPLGVMQAVDRYRVTSMAMMVDGAVELMDHPRFGEFDLSCLKRLRVTSFVKKLNVDYRQRWRELTGTTLAESSWGMTETHTSNTFTTGMQEDDYDLKAQPVFVGLPIPGTEFKICDFDTGAILPLDAEGEIVVRAPSLLKGYWNKPEESAAALRDGWLHSGDIGVIDSAGFLHYLGRRKEMLKVKGMSIFPVEIEGLLGKHPAVVGSGVIGRDDAEKGQVPVAFVELKEEHRGRVSAADLTVWLGERIAAYKVPEIVVIAALPLTPTGKVRKTDLPQFLPMPEPAGT